MFITILTTITTGTLMYYGGMIGTGIGILLLVICLIIFPKQRKKLLKKLGEE